MRIPYAKCPHCGQPLFTSESPRYVYQCVWCDEDFFECEAKYSDKNERDKAIEMLWDNIEDASFNGETECFEENVYGIVDYEKNRK